MKLFGHFRVLLKPRTSQPRPPLPTPTRTPTPTPTSPPADAMLEAINHRRASAGLSPLAGSPALMAMASSWAASMARTGRLSHGDFAARVASSVPNRRAAENVAQGQPDAASAVSSWMGSDGHRRNLLGPYDSAGWGMADGTGGPFWCAVFADLS